MSSNRRNGGTTHGIGGGLSRRDALRLGAGLAFGAPILSACQGGSGPAAGGRQSVPPPTTPTGVLKVAFEADPMFLDPSRADGSGLSLAANLYEGLTRYTADGSEIEGELAASFESSPDAREWIFKLKDGITFHDGEPLTSSAVKASFEYWRRTGATWPFVAPTDPTYDVSDPKTLRITTKTPFPDMARSGTMIRIVSPKLLAAGATAVNKTAAGTGPFKFVSRKTSENIILEANDGYRGPGPYVERLEFKIIPDPSARVAALRSNGVDLVFSMSPTDAKPLRSDGKFVVIDKPVWRQDLMIFFPYKPPANNLNVRQAIAHAIDKEAILKTLFAGVGTPSDTLVPPGVYGHSKPATTYPHDLDRARQLIGESGLPTPINMEIAWTQELSVQVDRVQALISAMVKEIGINLTVKHVTLAEIVKIFDTKYEMPFHAVSGGLGWVTGGPLFFATKYFPTVTRFHAADALIDKMLITPDGPERLQLLADVQEQFAQHLPAIPLYTTNEVDAHAASVYGYSIPHNGFMHRYGEVYVSK